MEGSMNAEYERERIEAIRLIAIQNRKMEMAKSYAEDVVFLIEIVDRQQSRIWDLDRRFDPSGEKAKTVIAGITKILADNDYGWHGPEGE